MTKPVVTKQAKDIKAGEYISYAGVRSAVVAVTPVYLSGGLEAVTLVLRDDDYAKPVDFMADRLLKVL